jgi:drug/metabolite transporter (DMT)-like permease
MRKQERRVGYVLVTTSAVAWSTAGLFTRLIHVDSWTMLAWRGISGAMGLALFTLFMPNRSTWRQLPKLGLLGWIFVLQSSAGLICFLSALRYSTVAHVSVIYATVPFFAAGMGWLLMRERPSVSALVTSFVALMGVVIMVGFGREGGILGDLLALGTTINMSVSMVIARRFPDMPYLPACCMSALLSGLVSIPFGDPTAASNQDMLWLILFGLTTFAVGLPLFTIGSRHLPAIETALVGSFDAPLAPLWVWLAFKETPSSSTIIGGSVVFVAVTAHLVGCSARSTPIPAMVEN